MKTLNKWKWIWYFRLPHVWQKDQRAWLFQIFTQGHSIALRSHCGVAELHDQNLAHQPIHPVQVLTDPVHSNRIWLHPCKQTLYEHWNVVLSPQIPVSFSAVVHYNIKTHHKVTLKKYIRFRLVCGRTFDESSSAVWFFYVNPANALVIWAEPVNSLLGPVVIQWEDGPIDRRQKSQAAAVDAQQPQLRLHRRQKQRLIWGTTKFKNISLLILEAVWSPFKNQQAGHYS